MNIVPWTSPARMIRAASREARKTPVRLTPSERLARLPEATRDLVRLRDVHPHGDRPAAPSIAATISLASSSLPR
jgi:hypothetical protein